MKRCIVELIAKNYMDMLAVLYPEKTWAVGEGGENYVLVTFEVNGMNIEDPAMSDCGRFDYDFNHARIEYGCDEPLYHMLPQINKYLKLLQE